MNKPLVVAQNAVSPAPKIRVSLLPPADKVPSIVNITPHMVIDLQALSSANIVLVKNGARLTILFDDGRQIILNNFYKADGLVQDDVDLQLSSTVVVAGANLASLLPISGDLSLLPASGTDSSSGAGTSGSSLDTTNSSLSTSGTSGASGGSGASLGSASAEGAGGAGSGFTGTSGTGSDAGASGTGSGYDQRTVVGGLVTGSVIEDRLQTATGQLTINAPGTLNYTFAPQVINGTYGTFVLQASGQWTYTLDNGRPATDNLAVGEVVSESFTAVSADGRASEVITLTVTGTNDAPVIAAITQSDLTEQADTAALSKTIAVSYSDVDLSDKGSEATASITAVAKAGVVSGLGLTDAQLMALVTPGAVSKTAGTTSGAVTLSFAAGSAVFDYLAVGEQASLTYTLTLNDGHGGVSTKDFVVTVTGTNDAPVIAAITQSDLTEQADTAALSKTIAVSYSDVDLSDKGSEATASITAVAKAGVVSGLGLTDAQLMALVTPGAVSKTAGTTNGAVTLSFAAGSAVFDYLAVGEQASLTYTLTLNDGHGGVSTKDFVVTVTGTNDAPVIAAITQRDLTEQADTAALSKTIAVSYSDVDLSDKGSEATASITAVAKAGVVSGLGLTDAQLMALVTPGAVSKTAGTTNGAVTLSFAAGSAVFDYLAVGEQASLTYTLTLNDGHGGVSTKDFVVTVTGTNDAPVIAAITQSDLTEQADTAALSKTIAVSYSDVDLSDKGSEATASITAVAKAGVVSGLGLTDAQLMALVTPGAVSKTAGTTNGAVTLSFAAGSAVFDYLAVGEQASLTYTLTLNDGHGGVSTKDFVVTVTGTNDAPVIAAITQSDLTEQADTAALSKTIAVSYSDVDLSDKGSEATASITAVAKAGVVSGLGLTDAQLMALVTPGAVSKTAGTTNGAVTLSFAAGSAVFDYLAVGEQASLTYTLTLNDGHGGVSTKDFVVTVTGTNDAPVIVAVGTSASGGVTEEASATLTTTGSIAFSDVDLSDSHTFTVTKTAGTLGGTLTLGTSTEAAGAAGGSVGWTYKADNSNAVLQALGAGKTAQETFDVVVDDGHGGTVTRTVTVTVTGVNDAAVIGTPSSAAVTEDGALTGGNLTATGTLSISDVDTGEASFQTAVTGKNSPWGSLTLAADGSYTYAVNNSDSRVQALGASQTHTDTFTVTAQDGTSKDIAFTINGTNDAPVVVSSTNGSVTEDTAVTLTGATTGKTVYSFLPGLDEYPVSVAFAANGSLYVSGMAWTNGNSPSGVIKHFLADGSLDTGFGTSGTVSVSGATNGPFTLTQDASGKLLVTGLAGTNGVGTGQDFFVERFNANGTVDTTFGTNGVATVDFGTQRDGASESVTDSSGRIVVVGTAGAGAFGAITRLNSDGTLDTGFATSGKGLVQVNYSNNVYASWFNGVAVDHSTGADRYVVAVGFSAGSALARYTAGGALDTSFGTGGMLSLANGASFGFRDVMVDATGRIYAVGDNSAGDTVLVRVTAAGVLDTTFGTNGVVTVHLPTASYGSGITLGVDGSLLVSVNGDTTAGTGDFRVYAFDTTGHAVTSFGTNGVAITDMGSWGDHARAIAVDPATGHIAVTGPNGHDAGLALYTADGALLQSGGTGYLKASLNALFSDVDTSDTLSATVTADSGNLSSSVLSVTGTSTSGTTTTFALGFSVNNADVQYLAVGETRIERFTVTANDGHGGTVSHTVTVTITGTNDAPVIVAVGTSASGGVTEEASATLTTTGSIAFSDVDLSDSHTFTVTKTAGTLGGTLTLGTSTEAAGAAGGSIGWTYKADNSNAVLQALGAGKTAQETFDVVVDDGHGGTVTRTVTVTVTGVNDAAVIGTPSSAAVTEDGALTGGNLTATGTLSISDVDTGEASFQTIVTGKNSPWGSLTLAADGSYTYAVNNSDSRVQALGASQTHTDTFTVTALDGTTKDITFTINGTNDAPVVVSSTNGSVTEDTAVTLTGATTGKTVYSFLPGLDEYPVSVAFAANGSLYVSGMAWTNGNSPSGVIKHFLADGSLDTSFGTSGTVSVSGATNGPFTLTQDASGKLLVTGLAGTNGVGTGQDFFVERFNANGTVDTTFGTNGVATVDFGTQRDGASESVTDSSGRIVVVGTAGAGAFGAITRLNSDGTLDTGFATSGKGLVQVNYSNNVYASWFNGVAVDHSTGADRYVVAVGFSAGSALARYTAGGALDTSFGTGGMLSLANGASFGFRDVMVDATGRIYAVGDNSAGDTVLVRVTAAGVLDTTFGTNGVVTVHLPTASYGSGITLGVDGSLLVSVNGDTTAGTGDFRVYAFDTTGHAVTSFGTNGVAITDMGSWGDYARAIAVDPATGHIAVTGPNGHDAGLALYTADGALLQSGGTGYLKASLNALFSDVDTSDTLSATVTADSGNLSSSVLSVTGTSTSGTTTTFALGFSVNNADVQYLAVGETRIERFTVTANDGHGGTVSHTVTVTITGTNDAPVIVAVGTSASGGVTEEASATLTTTGSIAFSDVDLSDSHTFTVTKTAGTLGGTLTLGTSTEAAGAAGGSIGWTYKADNSNAVLQALGAGKTAQETFDVVVDDGHGGTVTRTVTVTVTGVNDAAVIGTPSSAAVTEDGALTGGNLTATGTLSISDVDTGEASFQTIVTGKNSPWGSLTLAADGSYTYAVNNSDSRLQALGASQTHTDTFTVTALDGTSKDITFTINGTNDAPVIGTPSVAAVTEDANGTNGAGTLTATGTIGISDTDTGEASFQTAVTGKNSPWGGLTLAADGSYTYTVDNSLAALQALNTGQSHVDTFMVTAQDGTTKDISFTINGVDDNVAPVAVNDDLTGTITAGGEVRVNTTTANDQSRPKVAVLADGGYVVTWHSLEQDGSGYGVYAQRHAADGTASGGEFRVNTTTSNWQDSPTIAALSDGGFVVSWASYGQDGGGYGIYGQRYDANGATAGNEFQINSFAGNDQLEPSIAALANGGFVVTWSSLGQEISGYGIFGQRYDSSGAKVGGEFHVNTYTTNDQSYSSTIGLTGGGFVVTWQSYGQDSGGNEIYGQRYDASGNKAGGEFRINTSFLTDQNFPSAAALANGGFVVTWQSYNQDGSYWGVYGQRYAADGTASGSEFRVNTTTANNQTAPSVTALPDGGYVVTWSSYLQDGSDLGVYGQRYAADGTASGGEFKVNTYTTGDQSSPSVAARADGAFVVTWASDGQDGSNRGVYSQRYAPALGIDEDHAKTIKAALLLANDTDANNDTLTVSAVAATSAKGAALSLDANGNVVYDATGSATLQGLAAGETTTDTFTYTASDGHGGTSTATVTLSIAGLNDAPVVTAIAPTALNEQTTTAALTGTVHVDFTDVDLLDTAYTATVTNVVTSGVTTGLALDATALKSLITPGVASKTGGATSGSVDLAFSAASTAFDYLASGEQLTLTYTLSINDGHGGVTPQDFAVTVTGTNDAPVIAATVIQQGPVDPITGTQITAVANTITTGSVTDDLNPDANGKLLAYGVVGFRDVDLTDVATASFTKTSGSLASTFSIITTKASGETDGSVAWTYSIDNASTAVQSMAAGEFATEIFKVLIDDGHGGTVSQNVTVTVIGTDDAPVIDAITQSDLTEQADTSALTKTIAVTYTDVDLSDRGSDASASISAVSKAGVTAGLTLTDSDLKALITPGSITKTYGTTAGSLNLTFAAGSTAFDYLAAGETLTLTYTVSVNDGHGGVTPKDFVVTVTGTNDAPVIVAANTTASGNVTEDAATTLTTTGTIAFSDVDLSDSHTFTVSKTAGSLGGTLTLGSSTEAAGAAGGTIGWTYKAANSNAAIQALGAGKTAQETFDVVVNDGHGSTVTQTVTVTVTGVNDAATLVSNMNIVSTALISANAGGGQGNSGSAGAVYSADGTKVAFYSNASNLASSDTNGKNDVFVKDLTNGAVTLVSQNAGGQIGNGDSYNPVFSPDGTKVVFYSNASNLVSGDTNGLIDVFIKDLTNNTVTLVSQTSGGQIGNSASYDPVFSPDGTKVAFYSYASNLTSFDSNGTADIFVKDLATNAVTLISKDANGQLGNGFSFTPVFSPDGTKVAFYSAASNLVSGDTNGVVDVFVKDLNTGAVTLVSKSASGQIGNLSSGSPVFSPDGTKIAFFSDASNLVSGDTNGMTDIFVKDLNTGAVTLVSQTASGTLGNGGSFGPAFSPDGTKIAFYSSATNFVSGDTNGNADVFVKDLVTGAVTRVSQTTSGQVGNYGSSHPVFSPDGTKILFTSSASNLVSGDANNSSDIFITTLSPNTVATGRLTEDSGTVTASGKLVIADVDTGEAGVQAQSSVAGTYGSFALATDGSWTYTLNNASAAVQALAAGQKVTDSFTAVSADGSLQAPVTVTIIGANDTPVARNDVLDGTPIASGVETRINTVTVSDQSLSQVAALKNGGYVSVWATAASGGSDPEIAGQIYKADGTTLGGEFRVNSTSTNTQTMPDVVGLADGTFVVAWASNLQDGGGYGIYAQRFAADGSMIGSEFRVNTYTILGQNHPSVAALASGGFVIAWDSSLQDGSGLGIYAQRYAADGTAAGSEFRVNTYTIADQYEPHVVSLADGSFVITWSSYGQNSGGYEIYGQRYTAAGVAAGTEFRVNTYTATDQAHSTATGLSGGGFVVTWVSYAQDGGLNGVYGQRFASDGTAVGSEFRVNTTTSDQQMAPDVTALPDGGFLVTWESNGQDGSGYGVYAQRFGADGSAVGSEFRVNTYTSNNQFDPSVTTLADGSLVVTWTSAFQDGDANGVYNQRLIVPTAVVDEDHAATFKASLLLANDTDVDQDTLAIAAVSALSAKGAAVSLDASGNVIYDPHAAAALQALTAGQQITDTFTYTVSDGHGGTSTATVTVTVAGLYDPPNTAPTLPTASGKLTFDVAGQSDSSIGVTVTQNGVITIGGTATVGGSTDFALLQLNSDGTRNTNFGTNGVSTVDMNSASTDTGYRVTATPDGKFLLAGIAGGANGGGSSTWGFGISRFNGDGTPDTTFGTGGKVVSQLSIYSDQAREAVVQSDGKIVVVGFATNLFSGEDVALARYTSTGSLDTSFGSSGSVTTDIAGMGAPDQGRSVVIQSDGRILVGGYTAQVNSPPNNDFLLTRYLSNGMLDPSFGGNGKVVTDLGGNDLAYQLVQQTDGKIVLAGYSVIAGVDRFAVARYNNDGSLDASFNGNGRVTFTFGSASADAYSVALQSDGKIVLAGLVTTNGNSDFAMMRLTTYGNVDTSFGVNGFVTTPIGSGADKSFGIDIQPDDKILLTGYSTGTSDDIAVVRYNANGSLDTTFGAPQALGGYVNYTTGTGAVVLDSDVQFSDAELNAANDYGGATLKLVASSINDQFYATGSLGYLGAGAALTVNGATVGTVTQNNSGVLLLTFAAGAKQADVNAVADQIGYVNYADMASSTPHTITWTFSDGNTGAQGAGGAGTVSGQTSVIVNAYASPQTLNGTFAADTLVGANGNDLLIGGGGSDRLVGGLGVNDFKYTAATDGGASGDTIVDFKSGTDHIAVTKALMGTANTGLLKVNGALTTAGDVLFEVVNGNVAGTQSTSHLVYDATNHNLYYDADGGNTVSGRSLLAHLENGASIAATDINITAA